jgi:hypothetical protein
MGIIGKAWAELNEAGKTEYVEAAAADKARYEEELERATMVDASELKKTKKSPAKKPAAKKQKANSASHDSKPEREDEEEDEEEKEDDDDDAFAAKLAEQEGRGLEEACEREADI